VKLSALVITLLGDRQNDTSLGALAARRGAATAATARTAGSAWLSLLPASADARGAAEPIGRGLAAAAVTRRALSHRGGGAAPASREGHRWSRGP